MARCTKLRKRKRQYCSGELRDRVKLHDRQITGIGPGSTGNFGESLSDPAPVPAAVNTSSGRAIFGGTDTEVLVTHVIAIRYDPAVSQGRTYVEFDDRYLDIARVEDLDERHQWMHLYCIERGDAAQRVNLA